MRDLSSLYMDYMHVPVSDLQFSRYCIAPGRALPCIVTLYLRYISLEDFAEPDPTRSKLTIQHFRDRAETHKLYEHSTLLCVVKVQEGPDG
jgi:hypothetical protein